MCVRPMYWTLREALFQEIFWPSRQCTYVHIKFNIKMKRWWWPPFFWEALKISIILKKLLAISMGLNRPLNFFNGFEETMTRDTPKQAASVRNPSWHIYDFRFISNLNWFQWSGTIGRTKEWFQWITMLWPIHPILLCSCSLVIIVISILKNIPVINKIYSDFRKFFRFSEIFQIFENFSDFRKFFRFSESFQIFLRF